MLANTQFIENRVYDDDESAEAEAEAAAKAAEAEAIAAARAAAAEPAAVQAKWASALSLGMGALKFKYVDPADGGSGGEDIYNSRRSTNIPLLQEFRSK